MNFQNTVEFARQLDSSDPLKDFRKRFHIPRKNGKDSIYFTGHSLGLQPRSAKQYIDKELENWAELGVEGHFHAADPWVGYHENFSGPVSRIVGALPEEVVVMGQLTVNLHVLLTSFYRPDRKRYKIICEAKAFPSDQYALESQAVLHGLDPAKAIVAIEPRQGEYFIRTEDILLAIAEHQEELSLVLFGGINYYNGQVFDMKAITEAAHKAGAYAGFDLAHAAGNILLRLHDWDVDFACWCSYKYLNSGPGGVAGIYIHRRHATNTGMPRLAGWWGYEKESRFQMRPGFKPIPTAEGWQLSNGPVLSMAAHRASIDIFEEAGMEALVRKSRLLTGYLFYVLDAINKEQDRKLIELITPQKDNEHGCQVSMLMLKRGKEIFNELNQQGVIADWREPNVIRVAPVPLYNRFEDVWQFGSIISTLLT
jgi:kynureninase